MRTTARRLARAPAPDSQRLVRARLGPSPEKEDAGEATVAARLAAMLPPVAVMGLLASEAIARRMHRLLGRGGPG